MIGVYSGMSVVAIRDVTWRKSRRSNPSGNCVELAELAGEAVAVRDSKQSSGLALIYSRAEIKVLIDRVRTGELDGPIR